MYDTNFSLFQFHLKYMYTYFNIHSYISYQFCFICIQHSDICTSHWYLYKQYLVTCEQNNYEFSCLCVRGRVQTGHY